uniref:Ubiquinone biosynthesis protein UbiU n=1 Tax=Candidatus Kentrum sp. MB TaxID=2138164 RepID=A0A451BE63_9GAMM|nr:MAG: putative protease [Candidatus Kentron sp. MB]VFK34076.1 MAG: putative protease [Candidatus Kentron sp. MB]VFK76574.1 MAG: putative protease [Candidatus Kentron sp. MB]
MDLICPAGSLPALRAAVDNGADVVYLGFRDGTNARTFPGLNFDAVDAARGIRYAHERGTQVFLALNVFPQPSTWQRATSALAQAVKLGMDAVILADAGLLKFAAETYPNLRLHLSVQASATNHHAIAFFAEHFGIQRVILPRVLSLRQVQGLVAATPVEVEIFAFGSLCVMVEGRCTLSSFVTGESPNTCGVCSPARAVRWEETPQGRQTRLNGVLIDRFRPGEPAGYPTLCKGRYQVEGNTFHAIEEPTSLNVLSVLPDLARMGVKALKIEGRQRSPAYVAKVTRVLREAVDACLADPDGFTQKPAWTNTLLQVSEGRTHTLGALHRPWQ